MARIVWTNPALNDLHEIMEYIGRDSVHYARQFGERMVDSLDRLEMYPRCGRVVPEFEGETELEIRQIIYGSYRILYVVKDNAAYICAIVHGSRDLLRHVDPHTWDLPQ